MLSERRSPPLRCGEITLPSPGALENWGEWVDTGWYSVNSPYCNPVSWLNPCRGCQTSAPEGTAWCVLRVQGPSPGSGTASRASRDRRGAQRGAAVLQSFGSPNKTQVGVFLQRGTLLLLLPLLGAPPQHPAHPTAPPAGPVHVQVPLGSCWEAREGAPKEAPLQAPQAVGSAGRFQLRFGDSSAQRGAPAVTSRGQTNSRF